MKIKKQNLFILKDSKKSTYCLCVVDIMYHFLQNEEWQITNYMTCETHYHLLQAFSLC